MFRFSDDGVPSRVESASRCATYSKCGLRICPTTPFFLETSRKKICHDANLEVDREFLFNEGKKTALCVELGIVMRSRSLFECNRYLRLDGDGLYRK